MTHHGSLSYGERIGSATCARTDASDLRLGHDCVVSPTGRRSTWSALGDITDRGVQVIIARRRAALPGMLASVTAGHRRTAGLLRTSTASTPSSRSCSARRCAGGHGRVGSAAAPPAYAGPAPSATH